MTSEYRTYPARVTRVVDADTLEVEVDLGFDLEKSASIRLRGVDTHETYGVNHESHEYQQGMREMYYVEDWVQAETVDASASFPLRIDIYGRGKYGRYLAEVRSPDGAVLTDDLRSKFDGIDYDE